MHQHVSVNICMYKCPMDRSNKHLFSNMCLFCLLLFYTAPRATKRQFMPFTTTPRMLPCIRIVTNVRALIILSHPPSGAPYAGKTTCSFAVSPICKMCNRSGLLQSYVCGGAPHHQPLMLFFFSLSSDQWTPTARHLPLETTCRSGSDGFSSFLFTHHVSNEVRALPC